MTCHCKELRNLLEQLLPNAAATALIQSREEKAKDENVHYHALVVTNAEGARIYDLTPQMLIDAREKLDALVGATKSDMR